MLTCMRQVGKSKALVACLAYTAIYCLPPERLRTDGDIDVLCSMHHITVDKSIEQLQEVKEKIEEVLQEDPDILDIKFTKTPAHRVISSSVTSNGRVRVETHSGSIKSSRGEPPNVVIIDEMLEVDGNMFTAVTKPMMTFDRVCVCVTTPPYKSDPVVMQMVLQTCDGFSQSLQSSTVCRSDECNSSEMKALACRHSTEFLRPWDSLVELSSDSIDKTAFLRETRGWCKGVKSNGINADVLRSFDCRRRTLDPVRDIVDFTAIGIDPDHGSPCECAMTYIAAVKVKPDKAGEHLVHPHEFVVSLAAVCSAVCIHPTQSCQSLAR